jgi:hypothetical protein
MGRRSEIKNMPMKWESVETDEELQVYQVDENGEKYNLSNTHIIRIYQRVGVLPARDILLDGRLSFMELRKKRKTYSLEIEKEIMAIDFLLSLHDQAK